MSFSPDGGASFLPSDSEAARLPLIANIINDLMPDVLCIAEGPSSINKMRLFVSAYLDDRFDCFGGRDVGSQQLYILVRKNGTCFRNHPHSQQHFCAEFCPSILFSFFYSFSFFMHLCSIFLMSGPLLNARYYEEANEYLSKPWLVDVDGDFQVGLFFSPLNEKRCRLIAHIGGSLYGLQLKEYEFVRKPIMLRGEVAMSPQQQQTVGQVAEWQATEGRPPSPAPPAMAAEAAAAAGMQPVFICMLHCKSKFINGGKEWASKKKKKRRIVRIATVKTREAFCQQKDAAHLSSSSSQESSCGRAK